MSQRDTTGWLQRNWGYCAAMLVGLAIYLPAIAGEPIWDDEIVFERYLPTFRSLGDAFFPPADSGELGQYYYRPFITASYMLDNWLFGTEHHVGHHLTVMLLHVVTVLGVGLLTRRLIPDGAAGRWAAFAAAGCFAVHPVHVDSVAQISGRSDPMAGAFMVWSLLALLHGRDKPQPWWPWFAAGGLFFGGLLSKEVAAVTVVLAALLLWLSPRGSRIVWRRFGLTFGAALGLYLILRSIAGPSSAALLESSVGDAFERVMRAIAYYWEMVAMPARQAAFVPFEQTPPAYIGVIVSLLLLAGGLAAWRYRATPTVLRLAWVWFVVTLAPSLVLLFVKASEQPVAERYLYVPSIGFALAFGWLAGRLGALPKGARPTLVVVALLLAASAVATAWRSRIYLDNRTFWTDTAKKAPHAALPKYQLGLTLRKAGELDEATKWLEWAIEVYDDAEGRGLAHNTLGTIHLERQEWDDAEARFRAAIEERPDYATPWFNLASCYAMRANTRRGPQNSPDLADLERCVDALGQAVALRANYDKARVQHAHQSLQLTKVYLVHRRRADASRMHGRAKAAADWLVQRDPSGALGQRGRSVLAELAMLPR